MEIILKFVLLLVTCLCQWSKTGHKSPKPVFRTLAYIYFLIFLKQ